jgi:hypothetical protein
VAHVTLAGATWLHPAPAVTDSPVSVITKFGAATVTEIAFSLPSLATKESVPVVTDAVAACADAGAASASRSPATNAVQIRMVTDLSTVYPTP